jgi:hypothetical protein
MVKYWLLQIIQNNTHTQTFNVFDTSRARSWNLKIAPKGCCYRDFNAVKFVMNSAEIKALQTSVQRKFMKYKTVQVKWLEA